MTDDRTINLRPPLWLPVIVVLLGGCFYLGGKYIETRDTTELRTVVRERNGIGMKTLSLLVSVAVILAAQVASAKTVVCLQFTAPFIRSWCPCRWP